VSTQVEDLFDATFTVVPDTEIIEDRYLEALALATNLLTRHMISELMGTPKEVEVYLAIPYSLGSSMRNLNPNKCPLVTAAWLTAFKAGVEGL
jgi:hypothetical protein